MEILPGIHQVSGLRWSNAYLLVEEDRITLIDAGLPGDGGKILRYIERIGRRPSELDRVIVTHSHPDHAGQLKKLLQGFGAVGMIHKADTRNRIDANSVMLYYPWQPPTFSWNMPFLHHIPVHELIEDGQIV